MDNDELAVTKRLLKAALERRWHARPGTPGWMRACDDIKRLDRKVRGLTERS
jgi:hypothetical protein